LNPLITQKARSIAQDATRKLVEREITPIIQAQRGPNTLAEEAFVRAIYSPDKRLG